MDIKDVADLIDAGAEVVEVTPEVWKEIVGALTMEERFSPLPHEVPNGRGPAVPYRGATIVLDLMRPPLIQVSNCCLCGAGLCIEINNKTDVQMVQCDNSDCKLYRDGQWTRTLKHLVDQAEKKR